MRIMVLETIAEIKCKKQILIDIYKKDLDIRAALKASCKVNYSNLGGIHPLEAIERFYDWNEFFSLLRIYKGEDFLFRISSARHEGKTTYYPDICDQNTSTFYFKRIGSNSPALIIHPSFIRNPNYAFLNVLKTSTYTFGDNEWQILPDGMKVTNSDERINKKK